MLPGVIDEAISDGNGGRGSGAVILLLAALRRLGRDHGNRALLGPARGPAGLIAAISAANAGGGTTINLAAGCTYQLTAADNTNPMLGANGLPVITSRIIGTLRRELFTGC
jgi:hypothetical protein